MKLETKRNKLYWGGIACEKLVQRFESPLFVYDEEIIRGQARRLKTALTYPKSKLLYSCKANTNLAVLKVLR